MCVISTVVERFSIYEHQYYQEVARFLRWQKTAPAFSALPPSLAVALGMTNSINQRFPSLLLKIQHRWRFLSVLWMILLATVPYAAQAEQDNEAELARLRAHIENLQQTLDLDRGQRDTARTRLRQLDQSIGRQIHQLRQIRRQLQKNSHSLTSLKVQQRNVRRKVSGQRTRLARDMRAAYMLGKQHYLKLLLNQRDPDTVGRMLMYYRYFNEARNQRITALSAESDKLGKMEKKIHHRTRLLENDEARFRQEKEVLRQSRLSRGKLLASLNQKVRSGTERLAGLKRDERMLQRLLDGLPNISLSTPAVPGDFRQHRGRLPFPLRGRITARFGTRRPHSDLRWKGIFLAAAEGLEVKSVFAGRVVFADWLQGYGLLLILEHGDGYMTLYGNNESLYPAVGDWIEAGQTIASTGHTGNTTRSGLYFEVRHQGVPRNPLNWFRRG